MIIGSRHLFETRLLMVDVERHRLADGAFVYWHVLIVGENSQKLLVCKAACTVPVFTVPETTLIKTRNSVVAQADPVLTLRLKA